MRLTLDLHLHSQASPDGRMTVEEIAAAARARGLHGWRSVTTTWSTPGPTEVDGVLLIPGVEFSTEHGHLLGLFVRQPMVYTTWEETTQAVRRLGGLTVLAHPFQHRKEEGKLVPLVPYLDGMETWNGRANRKNPQGQRPGRGLCQDYGLIPQREAMPIWPRDWQRDHHRGGCGQDPPRIRTALLDGKGWITGEEGSSLCVARSQYTKLKKTHAPPLRYGRWAAFA